MRTSGCDKNRKSNYRGARLFSFRVKIMCNFDWVSRNQDGGWSSTSISGFRSTYVFVHQCVMGQG
jgi:outer membrane protease